MDNAWIVLIGTLGGVTITAAAGLATSYLGGRQRQEEAERQARIEHRRYLRDLRQTAFVDYMAAYRAMYATVHSIADLADRSHLPVADTPRGANWALEKAAPTEVLEMSRKYYTVLVTAGPATRQALRAFNGAVWTLAEACMKGDRSAVDLADQATTEPRARLLAAMRDELETD